MSERERRRHKRYDTQGLDGTLVFSVRAEVANISLSGMAVEATTPFTVGQSYSVRLGSGDSSLQLTANTCWCELAGVTEDADGNERTLYRSGFEFEDVVLGPAQQLRGFLQSKVIIDMDERLCGRLAPGQPQPVRLEALTDFKVVRISAGGMLIESETVSAVDSVLGLQLPLHGETLSARARVASVEQPRPDGRRVKHRLGLELLNLDEANQTILTDFIGRELEGGAAVPN